MTRPSSSFRVVVAGGGVAGLEALLALRDLAAARVEMTLLSPDPDIVYRVVLSHAPRLPGGHEGQLIGGQRPGDTRGHDEGHALGPRRRRRRSPPALRPPREPHRATRCGGHRRRSRGGTQRVGHRGQVALEIELDRLAIRSRCFVDCLGAVEGGKVGPRRPASSWRIHSLPRPVSIIPRSTGSSRGRFDARGGGDRLGRRVGLLCSQAALQQDADTSVWRLMLRRALVAVDRSGST